MTNEKFSLGDKIIQHLTENYNDFLFHDIASFLKTLDPIPTSSEIINSVSVYVNNKPPFIKTPKTENYSWLGTYNGEGLQAPLRTLDNLKVEVALTVDGQNYWSDKVSKQQPTIHIEDKRDQRQLTITDSEFKDSPIQFGDNPTISLPDKKETVTKRIIIGVTIGLIAGIILIAIKLVPHQRGETRGRHRNSKQCARNEF